MKISINKETYLTIKAMMNATGDDRARLNLHNVFWDHETNRAVATDGHVLRLEPMDLGLPESIQFPAKSFLLTPKQLRTMYPDPDALIEVEYIEDKENPYPKYKNVIKKVESEEDLEALKMQSFGFDAIQKFQSSFVEKHNTLVFAFTGQRKAAFMYHKETMVGVIMPLTIVQSPVPEKLEEEKAVTE